MTWSGKVLLWEEHGLFFGRAGDAALHESPAIKVCISLEDNFGLRTSEAANWTDYNAAMIAAGQPHAIEGRGVKMAMLLLAPEGELGQLLTGEGIKVIPDSILPNIRPLFQQFENSDITEEAASDVYQGVVRKIAGDIPPAAIDPRVAQSIEWLRAGREQGIIVGEIAAGVDLSESRFSHLFTEHVRVPVRRYLLWLRLRDALHLLAGGGSLTETAHEAGFADSAHLTRTFRTSLGIAPSELVKESSVVSFL
jgi:AraC family transcriptional regulator